MSLPKLNKCPFCGSEPTTTITNYPYRWQLKIQCDIRKCNTVKIIEHDRDYISDCSFEEVEKMMIEAINSWNNRDFNPDTQLTRMVERMQGKVVVQK